MSKRKRIGARRHRADVQIHDGTKFDDHGTPTFTSPSDWDTVVESWPCEVLTTGGQENVGGRQVAQFTTHMIYGAYSGGTEITADMRLVVDNVYYSVVAAYDPDGDRQEIHVEAKRES